MKPRYLFVLSLLMPVLLVAGCPRPVEPPPTEEPVEDPTLEPAWPRVFTDALSNEVTLDRPPERIISLSTGITEAIFAMGAGERVVGRIHFSDYPPEVRDVPSVGGLVDPSLEAIVNLEPELVLTERGTPTDVIDAIERVGIPVLAYDPISISEVLSLFREIGRVLGVESDANRLSERLAHRVEEVSDRIFERTIREGRPSLLFVIDLDPVFVAGEEHFVDDMIDTVGAVNAAMLVQGKNSGQWPSLSLEAVISLDPDIVITAIEDDSGEMVEGSAMLAERPGWRELAAVREGRVYSINPDLAVRAGPRLFDAIEQMEEIISDALSGGELDG